MKAVSVVSSEPLGLSNVIAYSYIRWSGNQQGKGDSFRRQIALRDAWLERRGIALDTSLMLPPDRGVSAFRGKNADVGALRMFLDAVKAKRVRPGSFLIVENLDRLSRDEVPDAVELFLSIINAGVVVVTLNPEAEFDRRTMNFAMLVLAIAELSRGHSESQVKSGRSVGNWDKRRKLVAHGQLITSLVPSWLDVDEDAVTVIGREKYIPRTALSVNPDKRAVVQRCFDLCISGMGSQAICTALNGEKVPPISAKAKYWHDGPMYRLLTDRACIGEYQPMKLTEVEGEGEGEEKVRARKAVGDVVKGYFPAVVSEETFHRAQLAIRSRKKVGSGRHGNTFVNLFTGIVQTEGGISYTYRERNGRNYLVLKNARTGAKEAPGILYPQFEQVMLRWLYEVKVDLTEEDVDVEALKGRRAGLVGRMERTRRKIKELGLETLYDTLAEQEKELKALDEEIEVASMPKQNQMGQVRHLIGQLADAEDKDGMRRAVRQQIKHVIKRIVVLGIEGQLKTANKTYRFRVEFSNGAVRHLYYRTANKRGVIEQGEDFGGGTGVATFDDTHLLTVVYQPHD